MAVERITVLLVTRDRVAMVMPYFHADEFRDPLRNGSNGSNGSNGWTKGTNDEGM
jgi:hypothetical protein